MSSATPRGPGPRDERHVPERETRRARAPVDGRARRAGRAACATHPWRVVGTWVGIIVVLIALVATIGGSLRDKFEIPGSDTQRATDLIKAEFAVRAGLRSSTSCSPRRRGQRLDTPERKAAIAAAVAKLRTAQFKPQEGQAPAWSASTTRSGRARSRRTGASPTRRRSSTRRSRTPTGRTSSAVEDFVRDGDRAGRRHGRVQRRGGVPAARAGHVRAARPARRDHRAAGRLPHVRRDADPDPRSRSSALATAFLLLFILAGLTDINTVTPILVSMIGLGVGIDYSLFIVTRFRQLLHDGLSPTRRRRGGRLVGGTRGALRRPDGRDLGDRAGVLRARLRHEARDRERARRADDRADRELAAPRGAARCSGTRSTGSRCRSSRRSTTPRRHARRRSSRAGAASSPTTRSRVPRPARCRARARRHLGARPSRRGRPGHAARRSRRAAVPTTCSPRASGPDSTGRSRSSST